MTPNLTELMQRAEEARSRTVASLFGSDIVVTDAVREERAALGDLIARLLSVIRCSECGGTGDTQPGWEPRYCPTCGPDRAAIERMK